MYADKITESMRKTIDETNRRREKQLAYNELHGIVPQAIVKSMNGALSKAEATAYIEPEASNSIAAEPILQYMSKPELEKTIAFTKKSMHAAAKELDFLLAAQLRDELIRLEDLLKQKTWN